MGRYINPFTDWGFKRIFGQEVNKDLLIAFLNDLFEGEHVITDLTFLDKEQLGEDEHVGTIIYDVFCQTDSGQRIIVEMQNGAQRFFGSRTLYYAASAIVSQGQRDKDSWRYRLAPVYVISLMNFTMGEQLIKKLRTDVMLADRDTGEVFSRDLRLIYLMLPLFKKTADECETNFERWIYVLKHMETLERIPYETKSAVFQRLGEIAEICALNPQERYKYDESIRVLRDNLAVYDGAVNVGEERGEQRGRAMERRRIAQALLSGGMAVAEVARITQLPEADVRLLAH